MPGVTVKDVSQQEFIRALAAFLKKARKGQPGWLSGLSGKLKVLEWVDTVKLAKHKELAPCDEKFGSTHGSYPPGGQRNGVRPSHVSRGSEHVGRKLTPEGPRYLDQIAGQVAAANKKHQNKCWVNKLSHS
ncbi:unnamed protein product [Nyctereutes procyonoides]|uniref:(raccoon dog) hypothetical protein n=1 Tax=Nyctereutes procyonoides TaxID=34880 RepID=A0A811Z6R0_NYCPR|nr:unnamed protein product [Nyctereutes procyonoides]